MKQWHVFFSFFFQVFISAADSCLVTPIYNWSRKKQHNWIKISTELDGNNYTFQHWHSYSENQKQSLMTSSQSQKIGVFFTFFEEATCFYTHTFPLACVQLVTLTLASRCSLLTPFPRSNLNKSSLS